MDVAPEVEEEDEGDGSYELVAPSVGHMDEAYGLEEHGEEGDDGRHEEPVAAIVMLPFGEEIAVAHDEHLDGEEKESESVDIEQRVSVANLEEVGEFKYLEQIDDSHSVLGWKQFVEVLLIGSWTVASLQQPSIEMGDDEGEVGGEKN